MNVKEIVKVLQKDELFVDTNIYDLTMEVKGRPQTDNRHLSDGDIFICIKGHRFDGHSVIPAVQRTKVSLIIQQTPLNANFPAIQVTNTRKAAALVAALYHGTPTSRLKIIGVTGTNGKTTTTMLIFQALRNLNRKCGWIGTLGYYVNDIHKTTEHTTPDSMELQGILTEMVDAGCEYVVMEVSSHSLALDRVYGVPFYISMFTNLSRDHLDFHSTMSEYAKSKYLLFEYTRCNKGVMIINIDDTYGAEFYQNLKRDIASIEQGTEIAGFGGHQLKLENDQCILKSLSFVKGDYWIKESASDLDGSRFILHTQNVNYLVKSPLIGTFNILNLALTVALLDQLQIPPLTIETLIPTLNSVPGRLQKVPNDRGISVYIDYAHTPDALDNVLQSLAKLKNRRLLCLFGAGGDRDKGKRAEMLTITLAFADAVIVTDDNPRFENPNQIIVDIISETDIWAPWWIIRNRQVAIESIINLAQEGDIVLIAGKGHEKYQEIEGVKHCFDDYQVAEEALNRKPDSDHRLVLPVDKLMLEILLGDHIRTSYPVENIKAQHYTHISTDSRSIGKDSIFFAIRGQNYDGHDYLSQAMKYDTNIAVVENDRHCEYNSIVTENTVLALGKLCRKYLQMFPAYRIALTGSTGKTSTKEFLANILSNHAPTLKTDKNENNIIGLCKTIQRIKPRDQYAVFEIGTNQFGEIGQLADIASPHCGIILNVGPSHLEAFGDEDGVYWEKTALFRRKLDKMIYCGDDERFRVFSSHGIPVGLSPDCKYRVHEINRQERGISFKVNDQNYQIPCNMEFYALNASFAIVTATELGVDHQTISQALKIPLELDLRMKLVESEQGTIIIDCYNANPVSMQKAIEYFFDLNPSAPHVAILGDMLELGDTAVPYHKMIGSMLSDKTEHTLITVGNLSTYYHSQNGNDYQLHFNDVDALIESDILKDMPFDAVILLKASHGIHLEKAVPHINLGGH